MCDREKELLANAKAAIENNEFNHGIATLKEDLQFSNKITVPVGTQGIITAFLPDMNVFSVLFDEKQFPGCWAVFDNQKWFETIFSCELKDKTIK